MGRLFSGFLFGLLLLAATSLSLSEDKVPADKEDNPPDPAEAAGKPVLVLDTGGHTAPVRKVLFTPGAKQVINISTDRTIRFWDVQTGQTLRVLRPPIGEGTIGEPTTGALSPDGKVLAVACWVREEEAKDGKLP